MTLNPGTKVDYRDVRNRKRTGVIVDRAYGERPGWKVLDDVSGTVGIVRKPIVRES